MINLRIAMSDPAASVLEDEAARAEVPIGAALLKALTLWVRLRRAERAGGRVYIATGQGDDTKFEQVEVL